MIDQEFWFKLIQEHKDFLLKIAHEIHHLLMDPQYKKNFEKPYQKLQKEYLEWKESNRRLNKWPIEKFNPVPYGIRPRNDEEEVERYYIFLAAIHDLMLPNCRSIDDGTCPDLLPVLMGNIKVFLDEEGPAFFQTAFDRVKVDLAEKEEAERESKAKTFGFHPKRACES